MGRRENLLRLAEALKVATVNRPPVTLKAVADALRQRQADGEALTERQREFAALDNAGPQQGVIAGAGMAIPDRLLPPGMRNGGVALDFACELLAKDAAGEWVSPDRLAAARSLVKRSDRQREAERAAARELEEA